ncbi:MAG: FAD synthetase family protein [Rhabdochlamydiaceae bacterium]|jgi:riboflavin kinase/FMN adenylyltransferase
MLLITDFNDISSLSQPSGLTIGNFDGVHLGHQALLKHLRSKLPLDGMLVVFTFFNHPSHLFTPDRPAPLICPPLQKVKYLADYGADIVILIPFTFEFAKTTFEEFLLQLKNRLGFSHLVLGTGSTFGKNRKGDEPNVKNFGSEHDFAVDYLPKTWVGNAPVSSGRIRASIVEGAFQEVQNCLGRPFSLMGRLVKGDGFYLFPAQGICLPSEGAYSIQLKTVSATYLGRAHPLPKEQMIRLESFTEKILLDDQDVELIF